MTRHNTVSAITARCFSSNPSDSTSRWIPCPPVVSRQRSHLGFTSAVSAVSSFVPALVSPYPSTPANEALPPLLDTPPLIRALEELQPS
jgi:hypothetical protein